MQIVELNNVLDLSTGQNKHSMTIVTSAGKVLVVPITDTAFQTLSKEISAAHHEQPVHSPVREIPAFLVDVGKQLGIDVYTLSDEELMRFSDYIQTGITTAEEPTQPESQPQQPQGQQATVLQLAARSQVPKPPTGDLRQDEDGVESV